jgi:hypothetical protein
LASPLIGAAFLNAVLYVLYYLFDQCINDDNDNRFGTYERSLAHFQKTYVTKAEGHPDPLLGIHYYLYAGAIGGAASTLVTCPVDVRDYYYFEIHIINSV